MPNAALEFRATYDKIVVGAGPAGCVLASRLSEEPRSQVLLLEAGPDAPPGREHAAIRDPFPVSSHDPRFHWPGLTCEPCEYDSRLQPYTTGYGVGGGSNVNGMAVDRGQPDDYDAWGKFGADAWSWDSVLPYFKKLENDLDFGRRSGAVHGGDGPMPVRRLPISLWAPFTAAVGAALRARGFPLIEDYTSEFADGLSSVPTNSLADGRVSASMAYLTKDVRSRPNLHIVCNARVDRLSIESRRADGVHVNVSGNVVRIKGRETILCCGGIQSPTVLLRSGIGPPEQLQRHGVPVVRELCGVGTGLQNHPAILLATYLPTKAFQPASNPWFLQNWLRYSSNRPSCSQHDMHLMQFNRTAWHALGRRVGVIAVSLLQPFSRGKVELANSNPEVSPKVRFNLLSDERDHDRLADGLRFMLELLADPAVASMCQQVFLPHAGIVGALARRNVWNAFRARAIAAALDLPFIRNRVLRAAIIDRASLLGRRGVLLEFVRRHTEPQSHDCGTCRMGLAEDAGAVVDGYGRVHGVEALRVVDASIFPTIPRGYPHFIVLMAAEKIADAIRGRS